MPLWADGAKSQIELSDPYILLDGGKYYAYGTRDNDGFRCYTSDDLRTWTYEGLALHKDNTTEKMLFWAPEVYHVGDKYIMYFTANQHLYVATSDSPLGPFKQVGGHQMQDVIGHDICIDSSVFFDDDGTAYLFFVRYDNGNTIWQCQLEEDCITPKKETLRKCCEPTQDWELLDGYVNEGPYVVKHKSTYYLTYSGNGYTSQDYAVGYATARSLKAPTWTKYSGNPILRRRDELVGTGHHCIFTDKEGIMRIAFHAHKSREEVHDRLMYIGTLKFSGSRLIMSNEPIIRPTLTQHPYNPEVIDPSIGFQRGSAATVDLNNDGYQDIVAGGIGAEDKFPTAEDEDTRKRTTYVSTFSPTTHRWTTDCTTPFRVSDMPSIVPCDINNDGNMDIIAFEQTGTNPLAEAYDDRYSRQGIFLGNGNGLFTEPVLHFTDSDGNAVPFDMKAPCAADVIDVDNDGLLDIVCAGHQADTSYNVILHQGMADDGGMHFTVEPYEQDFLFSHAVIHAADMNNDGRQDFVISSQVDGMEERTRFTDIYLNDSLQHGHFIRQGLGDDGGTIKRKANGVLLVADFTADGWPDIFLTGDGDRSSGETAMRHRMYANKQTPTPSFSTIISDVTRANHTVQTSVNNAAGTIDWDGDGTYDILLGGKKSTGKSTEGYLFLNTAGPRAGRLSKYCTIPGATEPCAIFPDWNGDGRKDYFACGLFNDANYLTAEQRGTAGIMCYNLMPTPSRPDAPVHTMATVLDDGVLLEWEAPESASPSSTYEVYIADQNGRLLNSTPAFIGGDLDGVRKVCRTGRVGSIHKWTFRPTEPGTYTWGVQTVDAAYNGSRFAQGASFNIGSSDGITRPSAQSHQLHTGKAYYSTSGVRHTKPHQGINIIRDNHPVSKTLFP